MMSPDDCGASSRKDLATGGVGDGDPGGWLIDVGSGRAAGSACSRDGGGASGSATVRGRASGCGRSLSYSLDKSYGGTAYITSQRVLTLLGAEGHLVRGHRRAAAGHRGSSSGLRPRPGWARPTYDGGPDGGAARIELARRWLRSFEWPLRYPTCSGGAAGRAGRRRRGAGRAADGRGGAGRAARRFALADDLSFPASLRSRPSPSLLPALDPTPMGWQGAGLVPRPAPGGAVRPDRQHRPDHLVGGARSGRLGAARVRGDRPAAA